MPDTFPWVAFGDQLRVNVRDSAALCAMVEDHLRCGAGFTIATLNLDHAVQLARPGPFRDAYARHSHVTADGVPVAWLARRLDPRIAKVSGSDLMLPLAEIAARQGAPVGLIGSTRAVLDAAAAALQARFPGLQVVARIAPSYPFDPAGLEADALIADVQRLGVRLCLLALGAPRQEILAARIAAAAPAMGVVSIGAGLDFVAGTARRAPAALQRSGLEWAWRLAREPIRLGPRYWRCIRILPGLVVEARRRARLAGR